MKLFMPERSNKTDRPATKEWLKHLVPRPIPGATERLRQSGNGSRVKVDSALDNTTYFIRCVPAHVLPDIATQLMQSGQGHRVKKADSEHCTVDNATHFIRCVLRVPIIGGGDFEWGVWVEVSREDFEKYMKGSLDTMPGKLANTILGYKEPTLGVQVIVSPTGQQTRPTIKVTDPKHLLTQEQSTGMPEDMPTVILQTLITHG